MLILERKDGQSILIGDDIVVTILKNRNGPSRVGIKAPKNIKILREELVNSNSKKGENHACKTNQT